MNKDSFISNWGKACADKINSLESQLAQAREEIEKLKDELKWAKRNLEERKDCCDRRKELEAKLSKAKEEIKDLEKEVDEMQEPMGCGHAQAEMQPSDEGPDMCIACYLQRELEAKLSKLERVRVAADNHRGACQCGAACELKAALREAEGDQHVR